MNYPKFTSFRRTIFLELFSSVSLLFIGFVFFSNIHNYFYAVHDGISPIVYYVISLAMTFIIILIKPSLIGHAIKEPIFNWFLVYILIGTAWALLYQSFDDLNGRAWRLQILSSTVFFCGLIISARCNYRILTFVLSTCLVIGVCTIWYDLLNPFFFVRTDVEGSNVGRGAGFFINANQAGGAVIVLSVTLMPFLNPRLRPALVLFMILGIIPTLSRSSISFAFIVIIIWIMTNQLRKAGIFNLMLCFATFATGLSWLVYYLILTENFGSEFLLGRLGFFFDLGMVDDHSSRERSFVALHAIEKFYDNPLTGLGIGTTRLGVTTQWGHEQSTHNMYLLLLAEQGILGGFLYLTLLGLIIWCSILHPRYLGYRQSRDIGIALFILFSYFAFLGFFSHTLLEEPIAILSLAILLTSLKRQDTSR